MQVVQPESQFDLNCAANNCLDEIIEASDGSFIEYLESSRIGEGTRSFPHGK